MKLLLATNNAHKVAEIKAILGNYFPEISTLREAGVSFEAVEDGTTFEENAVKKAEQTLDFVGDRFDAALADDSGLCVDALDGAPGVYSARFAGEGHDDAANNALLMEKLKDANCITEQLKRTDQMEWVRRMNSIKAQADEIVLHEVIYSI